MKEREGKKVINQDQKMGVRRKEWEGKEWRRCTVLVLPRRAVFEIIVSQTIDE
jgi:hypothetical protein